LSFKEKLLYDESLFRCPEKFKIVLDFLDFVENKGLEKVNEKQFSKLKKTKEYKLNLTIMNIKFVLKIKLQYNGRK